MNTVLLALLPLLALLTLVLVPAIKELIAPTDISPLHVPHDQSNQAERFALSFRDRLQTLFGEPLGLSIEQYRLDKGETLVGGVRRWLASSPLTPPTNAPLACAGDLHLPEGTRTDFEVYASGHLSLGARGRAHALLADGDVRVGAQARVLRWVHGRHVWLGKDSKVMARVSADQRIELARGATFVRGHATVITLPATEGRTAAPKRLPSKHPEREFEDLIGEAAFSHAQFEGSQGRWLVSGDLKLPPATRVRGNLIVRGKVHLGEGCRVEGSLKVHGALLMDAHCVVTGSCIGMHNIKIGAQCQIAGPLVAESKLRVGLHSVVGTLVQPTSATARVAAIYPGAVVHGTLYAKQQVRAIA
jgi:cytoskeletal protein CcmA (bactofilin family)